MPMPPQNSQPTRFNLNPRRLHQIRSSLQHRHLNQSLSRSRNLCLSLSLNQTLYPLRFRA